MKTKLLVLFSLLALLLVSTSVLADGRPTGIRIGRATGSFGGTTPMVEIDVTITGTDVPWNTNYSTAWLGYAWSNGPTQTGYPIFQYASSNFSVGYPHAIEWGDGYYLGNATLFGPPGGPWQGTFAHTYQTPGSYTITVGKAISGLGTASINTGNLVVGYTRYAAWTNPGPQTFAPFYAVYYPYYPVALALTANTTVRTGFGIPTTNTYGLIALALLLVGSGLLLYRKPQRI